MPAESRHCPDAAEQLPDQMDTEDDAKFNKEGGNFLHSRISPLRSVQPLQVLDSFATARQLHRRVKLAQTANGFCVDRLRWPLRQPQIAITKSDWRCPCSAHRFQRS